MSKKKLPAALSVAGVIVVGVVVMVFLTAFKAEAAKAETETVAREVRTMVLVPEQVTIGVSADGFLEAARSVDVQTIAAGRVEYARGDLKGGVTVVEGDLLVRLDDRRASLAYGNARLELLRLTTAFLSQVEGNAESLARWRAYRDLIKDPGTAAVPEPPAAEGRERLLAATMGVQGAWYALNEAALNLEDHTVIAPFGGTLAGDGIAVGSWVSPGTPLATLVETSRLELRLDLPEEDLARITEGARAVVYHDDSGSAVAATVVRIEPLLQSGSQTARVHLAVNGAEGSAWRPGAYVRATIDGGSIDRAYRLPRRVLVGGKLPIYDEGELALIDVTTLVYQGEDVVLAADLPQGTEAVWTILQSPIVGMALRREGSDA